MYKFQYRRYLGAGKFTAWETVKVVGHQVDGHLMVLFMEDGGQRTIVGWNECEVKLGTDWVLAVKEAMEQEANQPIKVSTKRKKVANG